MQQGTVVITKFEQESLAKSRRDTPANCLISGFLWVYEE